MEMFITKTIHAMYPSSDPCVFRSEFADKVVWVDKKVEDDDCKDVDDQLGDQKDCVLWVVNLLPATAIRRMLTQMTEVMGIRNVQTGNGMESEVPAPDSSKIDGELMDEVIVGGGHCRTQEALDDPSSTFKRARITLLTCDARHCLESTSEAGLQDHRITVRTTRPESMDGINRELVISRRESTKKEGKKNESQRRKEAQFLRLNTHSARKLH
ncbi:MAG: hypothetical protein J3Q66DRAFT_386980 [Benniella sp.]|nr:MAG: hypothetical protein J3Q66DRAFT_386980 [Benniella sp.]